MLNLLRMEIYRSRKSKTILVTLVLMALVSFASVYFSIKTADISEAVNISSQFTSVISNGLLLILWAVAISVYISAEYKSGFIKSVSGQIKDRGNLAVSKLLFFIIYTVEMFAISFIVVLLSAFIFSKNNITLGLSSQIIVILCVQFLLHIAFSCIFILITILSRGSALGIGLGIFMGCGLTSLIYRAISMGVNWLLGKAGIAAGFNLESFMIETNVSYIQIGITYEYILRAVLIGFVFSIVMIFASVQVLDKKDI